MAMQVSVKDYVAGDSQLLWMMKMLSTFSMLCEVTDERVFRKFSSIALRIQWEGNVKENGHATAGILCKTIHSHIVRRWPWSTLSSTLQWLLSICHIPKTCHHLTFRVFTTEHCSERTTVGEHRGSPCKSDESTDRGIKKRFAGRLPTYSYQNSGRYPLSCLLFKTEFQILDSTSVFKWYPLSEAQLTELVWRRGLALLNGPNRVGTTWLMRQNLVPETLCFKKNTACLIMPRSLIVNKYIGFDSRWGEFLIYLILLVALGPGVYSASNRNEYQKH
jgi:hypothetical protein